MRQVVVALSVACLLLPLGLQAQVEPHAILSQPHNGRAACIKCGYCMFFGCEVGAKSSTLAAMIPLAEASGHCEIRAECAVFRIETDESGRASEVLYYDADGNEQAQHCGPVPEQPLHRVDPEVTLLYGFELFADNPCRRWFTRQCAAP